jgi:aminoglycoside phosphotransferase (APT) family kinase protein
MQLNPITTPTQQTELLALLDYLYQHAPEIAHVWEGWQIERVLGGQNNLVYHACHACGDFAVKFTRRDERNRAGREYNALLALQQAGLKLAPTPYLLADERDEQLANVQAWLAGEVSAAVPQNESEWRQLLEHILLVQSVKPESTANPKSLRAVPLPPAMLAATHPSLLLEWIKMRAAMLSPDARLAPLQTLLAKLESRQYPNWPTPTLSLLHCDPNMLNFVRRRAGWLAVDWENSGWGDPALEMADLLAHAAFMAVPLETWQWVVNWYGERCGDGRMQHSAAVSRIWAYYPYLLVFWVVIFTKGMHDLENGLPNERLAPRPADWADTLPIKYEHYLKLAKSVTG